ncbi:MULTISPECIES: tyrosine-type recombinase/integrase [Burkholderia cepacia complex]|nr:MULTISPECIES: tyrosine-type recombinase/integrase [Burkholderia cepacia complex]
MPTSLPFIVPDVAGTVSDAAMVASATQWASVHRSHISREILEKAIYPVILVGQSFDFLFEKRIHAGCVSGIDAPTTGAHQFRHGLAADMLRHGASLSEIGEILGHRDPQTTMIYTKIDIEALRTLAVPWPGGAQ